MEAPQCRQLPGPSQPHRPAELPQDPGLRAQAGTGERCTAAAGGGQSVSQQEADVSAHNQSDRPAVWWSQQAPQAQACRHGPSICAVVRRLGPPHAPEAAPPSMWCMIVLVCATGAAAAPAAGGCAGTRTGIGGQLGDHAPGRVPGKGHGGAAVSASTNTCMQLAAGAVLCCPVLTTVLYSTCAGHCLTLLPCAAHRQPGCGTAHNNVCSCPALPSMLACACACADLAPAGLAAR